MNLNLAKKFTLSFGLILAILAGLGGYAVFNMQEAADEAQAFNKEDVPGVFCVTGMDRDWQETMFAMRGYAYTHDPAELETVRKCIGEVQAGLKALPAYAQALHIEDVAGKVAFANDKIRTYLRLVDDNVRLDEALAADKKALNAAAQAYMAAAEEFVGYQRTKLTAEINAQDPAAKLLEREARLLDAQELIDHGMEVRLAVWKAIAEDSPEALVEAKKGLGEIASHIAKVRPLTTRQQNLDQIAAIEKAAATYAAGVESYRLHLTQLADNRKERLVVATAFREFLAPLAEGAEKNMLSDTVATVDDLSAASRNLWLVVVVATLLAIAIAVVLTRALTGPIRRCVAVIQKLAQGDLTATVGHHSGDELGILANAIDTSIGNLRKLVGSLQQAADDLQKSALLLNDTAASQAATAEESTVQANSVASAGEQLSSNAKAMSASAYQITQSTTTVAAAMEEMSSSIQEVARNCSQESEIARKADTQARATRELMGKLDESARQIGKVVELINRIAEQTNLLALNATIEAASAGEAGRGFAVVANEVKELARQSAAATEDIRTQVTLIQDNTGGSIKSLDEVGKIIEQVSHISSSIAAAVEEQSATTSEIVGTVHGVSTATGTLSQNVQQTADGAAEVARNIAGVSQAADAGAKGAIRISTSATELSQLSGSLGKLVAQFKI
jgi:methyl-accepting chemotaxis protein